MTQIIAFAGRKQSGKTISAEFVQKIFYETAIKIGWVDFDSKIYNFADPLKQNICIDIMGLTYNQCYGTDHHKNELVDCYWNNKQLTAREVMQIVGTDIFRKMQTSVWSNAIINTINKEKKILAIIADCRFPNEVETIKRARGMVIKLSRNPYNSNHASEIALDKNNYDQSIFDLVIDNDNMSISQQNEIIYDFIKSRRLLPL